MILHKKQIVLIIIVALAVISVPGVIFGYPYFRVWQENREFLANPQIHDDFLAAREKELEIKTNPDRIETYITAMNRYKGLGDVTKDGRLYARALAIGDLAAEKFGTKSYVPYLNKSTIYTILGEYDQAEAMIKKSIEMSPGDAQLYLRLVELYKDFMKKDEAAVIAVYENAIQRLVNVLPVYNDYAAYLRQINRADEALDKYEILHKAVPDNPAYTQAVKELQAQIKGR